MGKLPKVVYSVATKAKQVRVPGLNQLRGDASGRERKMRVGKKLFDSIDVIRFQQYSQKEKQD